MSTTTHPFAPEEIMALLDGELSADRAQSLSAHLEQCAACQDVKETVRSSSQKIAVWKVDARQQLGELSFLTDAEKVSSMDTLGGNFSRAYDILRRRRVWVPALSLLVVLYLGVGTFTSNYTRHKEASQGSALPLKGLDTLVAQPSSVDRAEVGRGGGDAEDQLYVRKIPFPPPQPPPSGGPQTGTVGRLVPMIARTVSLSIVVKDFDSARSALDGILTRNNGYAAGLNVATPQGAVRTLQASLRIPASQLVAALTELKALGRVEAETHNSEEVTQQHADLVARLKNSRETEQRLQAILLQRTGKISDVLSVEQEIARVRGEIEQMEAEQQTLEHRVNFATIDLKLAEEYKAQLNSPAPSVASQVRNASVNGFRNAFESLLALILFFAEAAPTLLLWLTFLSVPAWFFWRRYRRSLAVS
jgi:uncharacterized protein YfiM (DUF2279 family)